MINTFLQLSRGLEYWQCWNLIWRPYWNPKWLPFQVLFLHILASGAVRNLIIVYKRMFQGMINTPIRLSRGLEYWKSWNLTWRPNLKPKWLPFQVLFLHILASGAVRNLIVVSKHMFQGMKKRSYDYLEIWNMGYVLNQDGRHIGIQNGCHFKLYFNISGLLEQLGT